MRRFALAALLLALPLLACQAKAPAPASPVAPAPVAAAPAAAAAQPSKRTVNKIVFIDKEHACECTQKAIDASWAALQAALGGGGVPVERIHMDTQEAFASSYREKRPMMAVPGIYFLDEAGAIQQLLQGDVTEAQVRQALQ